MLVLYNLDRVLNNGYYTVWQGILIAKFRNPTMHKYNLYIRIFAGQQGGSSLFYTLKQ